MKSLIFTTCWLLALSSSAADWDVLQKSIENRLIGNTQIDWNGNKSGPRRTDGIVAVKLKWVSRPDVFVLSTVTDVLETAEDSTTDEDLVGAWVYTPTEIYKCYAHFLNGKFLFLSNCEVGRN